MDYGNRPLAYYRDQGGVHPIFASYVPNDIINGHFAFWQRGTNFAPAATFSADRWAYVAVGTMVHAISRSTDVPGTSPYDVNYSVLIDCTTADTDIVAADHVRFFQNIEGFNFKKYVGGWGTLSFWVKATKPGIYCASFRNSGADRSYVVEFTVNAADTWEYKTITVKFDYSGGTWNYLNGIGLQVRWCLAAGTNHQTTPGAWQTGNYLATANQVNACDSVDNDFRLAKVKFEPGQVATPFVSPDYATELTRCQRYYEKSYDLETAPATVTGVGSINHLDPVAAGCMTVPFKVRKRATPTMVGYSTVTGTSGKYRDTTSGADFNLTWSLESEQNARVDFATHGAADEICAFHWTASAEL